jgi:hypothetical protein
MDVYFFEGQKFLFLPFFAKRYFVRPSFSEPHRQQVYIVLLNCDDWLHLKQVWLNSSCGVKNHASITTKKTA